VGRTLIRTGPLGDKLLHEQPPDWAHLPDWIPEAWALRQRLAGARWTPELGRRLLLGFLQSGPRSNLLHNAIAEHQSTTCCQISTNLW